MPAIQLDNRMTGQDHVYQEVTQPNSAKPKYWRENLSIFTAALGMVCTGFSIGWPTVTTSKLLTQFQITLDEIPPIVGCLHMGMIPGCIITTFINDTIGRKKTILITQIPFILSTLILIFPFNINCVKLSRFLAGVSLGAITTTLPVYLSEIASPQTRGKLSVCTPAAITAGMFFQNAVGLYLSIEMNGLITLIFGLVSFCLTLFIPETPYYYVMNRCDTGAIKSLRTLRRRDDIFEELDRIKVGIKKQRRRAKNFLELLKRESRKPFALTVILFTLQEFTGLNALSASQYQIFEQINSSIPINVSGIILTLLMFLSILLFIYLIDSLGRRKLLITSSVLMALTLILLSLFFYLQEINARVVRYCRIPAVILVYCYFSLIVIGPGGLPHLYIGELIPTNTKTLGSCACQIWGAITAFLTIQFHRSVTVWVGVWAPYVGYFVACVGLVGFTYYLPETTGLTLEDIQNELTVPPDQKRGNEEF